MRFLIVSRVSIPAKDRTLPCWEYLRSLGHTVVVEHPDSVPTSERPDVIISMGVTIQDETFQALERWPETPLFCYAWDYYAWLWEPGQEGKVQKYNPIRGQEYDYCKYGHMLARAREIWVPSHCTGRRTTQWYGRTNWSVILSACPWWDYEGQCEHCAGFGRLADSSGMRRMTCGVCKGAGQRKVRDDGYALCCLREIPDPWWGKFEAACEELGIPYRMPKHEKSYEEYQDLVAGCRFLCAPLYELSTGGLSLMEGYRLGKPVLISDSEWNGGRDYFGKRADYFTHGDMDDFKEELGHLFAMRPLSPALVEEQRVWIERNYSDRRMVDDMLRRIEATR